MAHSQLKVIFEDQHLSRVYFRNELQTTTIYVSVDMTRG